MRSVKQVLCTTRILLKIAIIVSFLKLQTVILLIRKSNKIKKNSFLTVLVNLTSSGNIEARHNN